MGHVTVCRICLATDVKLYDMCKYNLKTAYENLTGLKMASNYMFDHVCSFCGTLLNKFAKFRDKCVQTQLVIKQMVAENNMVTYETIRNINHTQPFAKHLQYVQIVDQTPVKEEIDNFDTKYDDFDLPITEFDDIDIPTELILKNDLDNASDEEPLSNLATKKKKSKSKNVLEQKVSQNKFALDDTELVILSKEEQLKEVESRKMSVNYLNSMYKCDICFKGFKTDTTYKNHMSQHNPSAGPIVCDICHMRRPNIRAMKAHTLITHERRYICKTCGASCKTSHRAREHSASHRGHKYYCHCGLYYSRSTSYLTHLRLQHPTSHICEICGDSFIGELGLRLHTNKAHKLQNSELKEYHACNNCGFTFKNKEALLKHSQLMIDGACDQGLNACEQCGDSFSDKDEFVDHMKMHQRNNAIRSCTECSRTFANEHSLSSHYQRAHARVLVQQTAKHCVCEMCGQTCNSKTALINHQRTHTGEKPYQCSVCNKRFGVYQRLQIHLRTHTGERPFKCTNCTKAFKHKAALNRHNRVHTGVKPYSCPQCGKCFSQSNSMKQHCAGVHLKKYIYQRRPNKHASL